MFINKYKFKDHPGRRRTFDRAFEKYTMLGVEVAGLYAEHGKALECGRQNLGKWLKEADQMYQDWQTSEVPSARKVARKMTKSRWECPADKEHHENIVVEMPLELKACGRWSLCSAA